MYSFSLKSIMQHSWSPIRLLNFLTSILQVTNREIKREREDDTQSYQQQKNHFTQNKYTGVSVHSCQKANVTQTHKIP